MEELTPESGALARSKLVVEKSPQVSVLGGFRFAIGGDALLVLSGGSQRLLAFLALHEQAVTRTAVAGNMWPEVSEDHAYASLRSALSRMEGTSREAIVVSFHDLQLAEDVDVDIRESRALAGRLLDVEGEPRKGDVSAGSVAALSADVLPGWYEDWAVLETEEWRQLRLHALEALAGRLTAEDRLADAAAAALAAVRAEPLRESARAALIRVHLAEGNQSEAVREYGRYRTLLHAELDLEPTLRLRELVDSIRTRRP